MIKKILNTIPLILFLGATLFLADSCDNPLEDKETGEDINLLVIDPDIFDTKIMVHLMDTANNYVDGVDFYVLFMGKGNNSIINMSGEYDTLFSTSSGVLEVAVDPGRSISESNPLSLYVYAATEDLSWACYPKSINITEEGETHVVITLVEMTESTKSAKAGPMGEPFDIRIDNEPFSQSGWSHSKYSEVFNDIHFYGMYSLGDGGWTQHQIQCSNLTENLGDGSWGVADLTNLILTNGNELKDTFNTCAVRIGPIQFYNNVFYSGYIPSGATTCNDGLTINIVDNDGFLIDEMYEYNLYELNAIVDGKPSNLIKTYAPISKSKKTIKTGPITIDANTTAFEFKIYSGIGNKFSPAKTLIPVDEFCGKTINVSVGESNNDVIYKVLLNIVGSDGSDRIKVAPTITGFYRLKGDTGSSWGMIGYKEGVCVFFGQEGAEYEFKIIYGDESYTYYLPTDESKKGELIQQAKEEIEDLEDLEIEYSTDGNALRTITITATYDGDLDFF